ncbi:hypothetical protein GCM10010440_09080 [Kitasatospora cinereorecta]
MDIVASLSPAVLGLTSTVGPAPVPRQGRSAPMSGPLRPGATAQGPTDPADRPDRPSPLAGERRTMKVMRR